MREIFSSHRFLDGLAPLYPVGSFWGYLHNGSVAKGALEPTSSKSE